MAGQLHPSDKEAPSKEHTPLFFYMMLATGLAFFTRAMPTPFLPLVLSRDFQQSSTHVGFAMSVFPLGAFLATPFAAAEAQRSSQLVTLHSRTLIYMAISAFLMAMSSQAQDIVPSEWSHGAVFVLIIVFRFVQGISQAYYMAANTSLICRRFTAVAYTVAMTEVALGSGAQLGRLGGGLLFDMGGLSCPFGVAALLLSLCALLGLMFEEEADEQLELCSIEAENSQDSWRSFLTLRIFLAAAGIFSTYVVTGFLDATLPQHLEAHLGPLSISAVSAISSLRSFSYLLVSWQCAHVLHSERIRLDSLLSMGFVLAGTGLILMAPQSFVVDVEALLPGGAATDAWTCQVLALLVGSSGNAMMFVPGLPLMQREVRHLGPGTAQRVSSLLMAAMSGGEFLGPLTGGAFVEHLGFRGSTALLACALLPMALLTLTTYQASKSRSQGLLDRQVSFTEESQDLAKNLNVPLDPETAYRYRRLAFVGSDVRRRLHSAPAQERRPFIPQWEGSATAPSTSFRRAFQSASASPQARDKTLLQEAWRSVSPTRPLEERKT